MKQVNFVLSYYLLYTMHPFRKYPVYLLFILTLAGCDSISDRVILEKIDLEQIPQQTLVIDSLIRIFDLTPPEIHLIKDTLVLITDMQDASHLRIYHINTKELKKYYLKSKKDSVQISEDKNLQASFHYFNKANRVYYDMEVQDGFLRIKDFHRLRIGERSPYEAVKADEKTYVGLGNYKDGLFSSFNIETRIMDYYGTYPLNHERYLYKDFLPYFTGKLAMWNNEVIYVSQKFGYISSYEYQEGKLKKIWEKQVSDFLFTQHNTSLRFDDNHPYGFQGVDIQNKQIYALYNGDSQNDTRDFKNSLLVFDHTGRLITHYLFPDRIEYIIVDEKEEYIYGIYTPFMNESWLARFKIH